MTVESFRTAPSWDDIPIGNHHACSDVIDCDTTLTWLGQSSDVAAQQTALSWMTPQWFNHGDRSHLKHGHLRSSTYFWGHFFLYKLFNVMPVVSKMWKFLADHSKPQLVQVVRLSNHSRGHQIPIRSTKLKGIKWLFWSACFLTPLIFWPPCLNLTFLYRGDEWESAWSHPSPNSSLLP
jgi:hypothetical protein